MMSALTVRLATEDAVDFLEHLSVPDLSRLAAGTHRIDCGIKQSVGEDGALTFTVGCQIVEEG